jgi:hypothetical protein
MALLLGVRIGGEASEVKLRVSKAEADRSTHGQIGLNGAG